MIAILVHLQYDLSEYYSNFIAILNAVALSVNFTTVTKPDYFRVGKQCGNYWQSVTDELKFVNAQLAIVNKLDYVR